MFRYDRRLNTTRQIRTRTVFPFYVAEDSPQRSARWYLWPFFSHIEDRDRDYEEWNFPWPLFRLSRGDYKQSRKFLPFYADERVGAYRKRWYLWPLYKIETLEGDRFRRRRDRVLFFLYSNLEETRTGAQRPRKKRVALWPLFTYERQRGVQRFFLLSLLDPFFPENPSIERNWSPLWRLYHVKWDRQGNEASSFLWNLYWKERRGQDLAMEVFPLFFYRRSAEAGLDFKLLKGLVRYRSQDGEKQLNFFYLPWGISWDNESPAAGEGA